MGKSKVTSGEKKKKTALLIKIKTRFRAQREKCKLIIGLSDCGAPGGRLTMMDYRWRWLLESILKNINDQAVKRTTFPIQAT